MLNVTVLERKYNKNTKAYRYSYRELEIDYHSNSQVG